MKIRTSFVANSSSSSFIVALPKKLSSDEFKEVLFPNKTAIGVYDYAVTVEEVVARLVEDANKKATKKQVLDFFLSYANYMYKWEESYFIHNHGEMNWVFNHYFENNALYFGTNKKLLEEFKQFQIKNKPFLWFFKRDENNSWGRKLAIEEKVKKKHPPIPEYPKREDSNYSNIMNKIDKLNGDINKEVEEICKTDKKYQQLQKKEKRLQKKFEEYASRLAKIDAEEFWNKYGKGYIFIPTYSDNRSGILGTVMEHGNIFKNVPHVSMINH